MHISFSKSRACSLDSSKYLRLSIATLAALVVVAVTWPALMVRRIADSGDGSKLCRTQKLNMFVYREGFTCRSQDDWIPFLTFQVNQFGTKFVDVCILSQFWFRVALAYPFCWEIFRHFGSRTLAPCKFCLPTWKRTGWSEFLTRSNHSKFWIHFFQIATSKENQPRFGLVCNFNSQKYGFPPGHQSSKIWVDRMTPLDFLNKVRPCCIPLATLDLYLLGFVAPWHIQHICPVGWWIFQPSYQLKSPPWFFPEFLGYLIYIYHYRR